MLASFLSSLSHVRITSEVVSLSETWCDYMHVGLFHREV